MNSVQTLERQAENLAQPTPDVNTLVAEHQPVLPEQTVVETINPNQALELGGRAAKLAAQGYTTEAEAVRQAAQNQAEKQIGY